MILIGTKKFGLIALAGVALCANLAMAQDDVVDPDLFADKNSFFGPPYFLRSAEISKDQIPDHWPFSADGGELTCVTVDGVAVVMFEAPDADKPFMIGENIIMTAIGQVATGAGDHIRPGYDPAKLIDDLEKLYALSLGRCGAPYAQ